MKRRDFISFAGGAAFAWPFAACAQQPAMPVIGFLLTASPGGFEAFLTAFRKGLQETGYVEGSNVNIEYRWAEGRTDRLPAMADDLVNRHAAVIVASGGDAPALAAQRATGTTPIVFISGGEPVKAGLVASLNRPGGNITGVNFIVSELIPKRLELMHEFIPRAATVGALVNPDYPAAAEQQQELQQAAAAIGLRMHIATAGAERDIGATLRSLAEQHTDMLLVANDPFFQSCRDQIIALAAHYALPASYPGHEYVAGGGLLSYGPDLADIYRLAGTYVGKVLKGAKPMDMPVQLPTKFQFAINLKTAKALGISVPQSVLATADEVIE